MSDTIITKICSKCKTSKNLREFQKESSRPNGISNQCKACKALYRHKKRSEDKNLDILPKHISKFLRKVLKTEYCWLWLGKTLPKGYGKFYLYHHHILAHRFSYLLHFKILPLDLDVLHNCDNPSCVNPNHLFLGTNDDNIADKISKNRQNKGESVNFAKLTEKDVINIRERASQGESHSSIARLYPSISRSNVIQIVHRRTWKHLP